MQEIKDLIKLLNYHTNLYNQGKPEISDADWDKLYFHLEQLEEKSHIIYPDSPTQKIEYKFVDKLDKVQHNHRMLSLAKTKNWDDFIDYFRNISKEKSVTVMPKLDGLTCSLRYKNGELISAETRGDGVIGEDVTHNILTIKEVPKKIPTKNELIVDGEIICTYQDFEAFSDTFANPRNFASGSIRLLDSAECKKRNLTFVVWNVIKGCPTDNFFMRLEIAAELGFTIVPWAPLFYEGGVKEYLTTKAKDLGYPIDGLVGRFNDINFGETLGETGHHPRAAYAFKFYNEEIETELLNIEWQPGKSAVLTPVAIFKPVELLGTIVEKASLHNISIMEQIFPNGCWENQKIKIYKANEIIPQISWSEKENVKQQNFITIPKQCPICKSTLIIKDNNGIKTLVCSNSECQGQLINKLDYYCGKNGLDIRGLSKSTLEKLIDWGWINSFKDIYILKEHSEEWKSKEGFGERSVDNILKGIEQSKKCKLENFISAISIPLISIINAKEICRKVKDFNSFIDLINKDFDFSTWDGFGEEKDKSIKNYDYAEAIDIAINFLDFQINNLYNTNKENKILSNKNFVITGGLKHFKNRNELKEVIEQNGGKVISSVSNNTNYLINNNVESTSQKNLIAKKLNIPIIAEEDLLEIIEKN